MNIDEPNKLPKEQKWSGEEVAKHNNDKDCWLFPHPIAASLFMIADLLIWKGYRPWKSLRCHRIQRGTSWREIHYSQVGRQGCYRNI